MTEPVYGLTPDSAKILREMADKHRQRLPDVGRRTRRVGPRSVVVPPTLSSSCADCNTVAETLTVEIDDPLFAAAEYRFSPFCNNSLPLLFTSAALDMESGSIVWTGTSDDMSISCLGDTVTFTAVMVVAGFEPGEVTIVVTGDDSSSLTFINPVAWDPGANLVTFRQTYTPGCKCLPAEPFPCLVPVEPA